jgi:hypothetical protein
MAADHVTIGVVVGNHDYGSRQFLELIGAHQSRKRLSDLRHLLSVYINHANASSVMIRLICTD